MNMLKVIAIAVGAILLGFLVASIAFFGEHAFLLWVSIGLLIAYGIAGLVAARRKS